VRHIFIDDRAYPRRLCELADPPQHIAVTRTLDAGVVVAIVGARDADPTALGYTRRLAATLVRAGVIVASGGALGIDRAAHEGALEAGGRTWLFAPCGMDHVIPHKNEDLYEEIKRCASSSVISVFPDAVRGGLRPHFFRRNAVMAAAASEVVCVQAGVPSGALNTMKYARDLGRRRWVVPPHPFFDPGPMLGCQVELERGAHALPARIERFVEIVMGKAEPRGSELANSPAPIRYTAPRRPLEPEEEQVLSVLTSEPRHTDEIAEEVGLSAPTLATALLTLALEDVVVEGPGGFFRRN
jgi:DNA processing protein